MNQKILYPTCTSCGRNDGISRVVVGPPSRDGYHDVATLLLACGHEVDPQAVDEPIDRLEDGVVDMLLMTSPDVIEIEA